MKNKFIAGVAGFVVIFMCQHAKAQVIADASLKKNVTEIENPLQKIVQLQPREFVYNAKEYKQLGLSEGKQYGFLADNVKQVFPDMVREKKVSYRFGKNVYRDARINTVDETALIPVLVASIQSQQEEIEYLKTELLKLKKEMAAK